MNNIRPIDDHILVRRDPMAQTEGGIYIPDTAKKKALRGVVLAVGLGPRMEDGTHRPMEIQVGDRIIWNEYAGAHADFDADGMLMIKEQNVLGWEVLRDVYPQDWRASPWYLHLWLWLASWRARNA